MELVFALLFRSQGKQIALNSVARSATVRKRLSQIVRNIGIDIDGLVLMSGLVEFNLFPVIRELAAKKRSLLLRARGCRGDGKLAIFFPRKFAIRSLQPDHHVLLIHECRAHLLRPILVFGNPRHDRIRRFSVRPGGEKQ